MSVPYIAQEIAPLLIKVTSKAYHDVDLLSNDCYIFPLSHNARFVRSFLDQQAKASIYQERFRILQAGGILRLIEDEIANVMNSQTLELLTMNRERS